MDVLKGVSKGGGCIKGCIKARGVDVLKGVSKQGG